jgi:hypothetical protein
MAERSEAKSAKQSEISQNSIFCAKLCSALFPSLRSANSLQLLLMRESQFEKLR